MNKNIIALSGIVALVATATALKIQLPESQKPNIVFILTDNLGYGELGCYGGGILRIEHLGINVFKRR